MIHSSISTKEEAVKVLESLIPGFHECILSSFNDYYRLHEGKHSIYRKTTKANIIFDFIIHYVKLKFVNNLRIRFLNDKGLISLIVDDKFLVKFKKLDDNHRSSNVRTSQNSLFVSQGSLFDLTEEITNIEIGYVLNVFGNEILGVFIVCPKDERKNHWEIDVEEFLEKTRTLNLFPETPITPKKDRFKIKEELKKDKDDESGKVSKL